MSVYFLNNIPLITISVEWFETLIAKSDDRVWIPNGDDYENNISELFCGFNNNWNFI
jgi:hypothetical protein